MNADGKTDGNSAGNGWASIIFLVWAGLVTGTFFYFHFSLMVEKIVSRL